MLLACTVITALNVAQNLFVRPHPRGCHVAQLVATGSSLSFSFFRLTAASLFLLPVASLPIVRQWSVRLVESVDANSSESGGCGTHTGVEWSGRQPQQRTVGSCAPFRPADTALQSPTHRRPACSRCTTHAALHSPQLVGSVERCALRFRRHMDAHDGADIRTAEAAAVAAPSSSPAAVPLDSETAVESPLAAFDAPLLEVASDNAVPVHPRPQRLQPNSSGAAVAAAASGSVPPTAAHPQPVASVAAVASAPFPSLPPLLTYDSMLGHVTRLYRGAHQMERMLRRRTQRQSQPPPGQASVAATAAADTRLCEVCFVDPFGTPMQIPVQPWQSVADTVRQLQPYIPQHVRRSCTQEKGAGWSKFRAYCQFLTRTIFHVVLCFSSCKGGARSERCDRPLATCCPRPL